MFFYQIKVIIKENKVEEFVKSLRSLSRGFQKETGCVDFSLYRHTEKINTFSVIGEWKTRQAMEKHFKNKKFEVLVGATRVLGDTFEMSTGESSEKGGFQLAREKISLQSSESGTYTD
jgi:quinol monooxygenase YgiN